MEGSTEGDARVPPGLLLANLRVLSWVALGSLPLAVAAEVLARAPPLDRLGVEGEAPSSREDVLAARARAAAAEADWARAGEAPKLRRLANILALGYWALEE